MDSPERHDFYGKTLEEELAWCLVWLMAPELGIGPGTRVLDLAAGTGKLTRQLVDTGAELVAVEPIDEMRA